MRNLKQMHELRYPQWDPYSMLVTRPICRKSPAITPYKEKFPSYLSYLISLLSLVSFVSGYKSRGGTNRYEFTSVAGNHRRVKRRLHRSTKRTGRRNSPVCESLEGSPGMEKIGNSHVLSI